MLKVGVIGAGRVGAVLAAKLTKVGHVVVGVSGSSPASQLRIATLIPNVAVADPVTIAEQADVLFICVRDDALAEVVSCVAPHVKDDAYVCHTSGRFGRDVLEPITQRGVHTFAFHPAMTFTGTDIDLDRTFVVGATCVDDDREFVVRLADAFNSHVEFIAEEDRVKYHAALTHGANHITTIVVQAMEVLRSAGIAEPSSILRPLLTAALDNALDLGPAALTGPVVRGDVETVSTHIAAIAEPTRSTYRALADATVDLAVADQRIDKNTAELLRSTLSAQEIE